MSRHVGVPTTAAAFLAFVTLLACSSGAADGAAGSIAGTSANAPSVASVAFESAVDTLIVGRRDRLIVRLRDASGAAVTAHDVLWSTADSSIAAFAPDVASDRLVSRVSDAASTSLTIAGVSVGATNVAVVADGRSAGARIVVVPAPSRVARVAVAPNVDTIVVGKTMRLTIDARDVDGALVTARDVAWSSRDSSVASLAKDRTQASIVLSAVTPGVAQIDVVADGRSAGATIVVVAPRVAAIRLRRDTVRLHVGESTALVATPVDDDGDPIDAPAVKWSSADTSVAVVAPNGVVTARSPKTTRIVASIGAISSTAPVSVRPRVGDVGAPLALELTTYEGSGQVVHPDVIRFAEPWNGYRYWMAITPYPNANDQVENPSVFGSDDGENWELPEGAVNPLARSATGHLSDPALVFDESTKRLLLYYRDALGGSTHSRDDVYLTSTADGVHWAAPVLAYSDTGLFVLSPSVVRRPDGGWRVWSIDAGVDGCRAGATGVVVRSSPDGRRWNASRPVALVQPGQVIWHIDVQWVAARREYWALYAAYSPLAGCSATDLYLATSPDGERWTTYPSPVLAHGVVSDFEMAVYRSTFAVDVKGDSTTLWLSGARRDTPRTTRWSAALARTSVSALLARIAAPASSLAPVTTRAAAAPMRPDGMP